MRRRRLPALAALVLLPLLLAPTGTSSAEARPAPTEQEYTAAFAALAQRDTTATAGAQEEGGDAEGLEWFYAQRSYPDGIPPGAYSRARGQARRLPAVHAVPGRGLERVGQPGIAAPTAPAGGTRAASGPKAAPGSRTGTAGAEAEVAVAAAATPGGRSWVPLGPAPVATQPSGLFRVYSGPPPFSGRVTAIAPHPTNSRVAYVGGAVGGVWKTVDGGTTFRPVFDGQDTLAIGAVAVDRLNPETVYVGTGEANSISTYGVKGMSDSYYGTGLYKSTNGGASWAEVGAATFGSCHVAAVQPHPTTLGVVLAAVTSSGVQGPQGCAAGLYRSVDGGATWTRRLSTAGTGGDFAALSLSVSPAAPTRWFAGIGSAGVYRSTDSGVTWTFLSAAPLPAPSLVGRVAVSVSPVDANRVYAAMSTRAGASLGVWTTGNGGGTWARADASGQMECTFGGGSQCTYDLALAASPGSAGTFTTGGIRLRRYTSFGAASARVLDPYTNGGAGVHWDVHVLVFDAAGRLWIGTDGGAYRWDDIAQPAVNLNATLSLSQFYPGISGTTSGLLVGGTQDMASHATNGSMAWVNQSAGDGGYTAIDRSTSPATVLTTSQFFNLYRSTDGGARFAPLTPTGIDATERRQFITPMVAGTGSPTRLYAGLSRVYRSVDRGSTWQPISPVLRPGDTITALAQAPSSTAVVWAATSTGRVFRTLNATAATPAWLSVNIDSDPVPYRFITDLAVDPSNPQVVHLTLSGFNGAGAKQTGHVFRSTDGGNVWVDVSGNLPNTPANAVAVVPNGTGRLLFVGTDVGVFASSNAGATWARYQTGLPNVVVSDLQVDPAARRLVAATHGRGMFTACSGASPAGDAFGAPRALTGTASGASSFTTTCAGREAGEPAHSPDGNTGGASVWLRWTAPASGSVVLSTAGSGFDTTLGVYRGSTLSSLTRLASSDDVSATDQTSRVTFAAVAGQVYRVAVDGYTYDGYALARNGAVRLAWSTG